MERSIRALRAKSSYSCQISDVSCGDSQHIIHEKVFSDPVSKRRATRSISTYRSMKGSSSSGKFFVEVSDSEAASLPTETVEVVCSKEQEHAFVDETGDAKQFGEEELPFLTGDVYFDVVLSEAHFNPGVMYVPRKISNKLPHGRIVTDFVCNGNNWRLWYIGNQTNRRFDNAGLKSFLMGMKLAVGDGCVFQLVQSSIDGIIFRVIILRDEVPPELLAAVASRGSQASPIELD